MSAKDWIVGKLEKASKMSSADAAYAGSKFVNTVGEVATYAGFVGGFAFAVCNPGLLSPTMTDPIAASYGGVMVGFAGALFAASVSATATTILNFDEKAARAAVALRDGAKLALEKMKPEDDAKALGLFAALSASAAEISARPDSAPAAPTSSKPRQA